MTDRHASWFKFYPADFMGGVRGLTPQEVGLYTMLLCRIYEENGPIEFNVLRLSTYCGMRVASFEKTVQKLVDLGKLYLHEGLLSNTRAEIEISNRANGLKNASHAGKVSAEKRQQNQKQASTDVQPAFNHTDTDTDTDKEADKEAAVRASARDPDPPDSNQADRLHADVMAAVGLTGGRIPTHWMPPAATIHVNRWVTDLGLTHGQIIEAARESRKRHDKPPNGPLALDDVMRKLAATLRAPPLTPAEIASDRPAHATPQRLWNLDPNQFNPDGSLRQ